MYPVAAVHSRSFASSGTAPSIAPVQQKVGSRNDATTPLQVFFDASPTEGNLIVACISFIDTAGFDGMGLPTTIGSATLLTETVAATNTGVKVYIYSVAVSPADTGVEFTLDLPVAASMNISEWSSITPLTADDTSTNTGSNGALGVVPPTLDPAAAPNLVIGIGGYVSADDDYSSGPSNGFTRLTQIGVGAVQQECAYLIREADHSPITSVVTLDEADVWAGCAAAFVL